MTFSFLGNYYGTPRPDPNASALHMARSVGDGGSIAGHSDRSASEANGERATPISADVSSLCSRVPEIIDPYTGLTSFFYFINKIVRRTINLYLILAPFLKFL